MAAWLSPSRATDVVPGPASPYEQVRIGCRSAIQQSKAPAVSLLSSATAGTTKLPCTDGQSRLASRAAAPRQRCAPGGGFAPAGVASHTATTAEAVTDSTRTAATRAGRAAAATRAGRTGP